MTILALSSSRLTQGAASRLRRIGVLTESVDWARRASACEACPLRVIQKGVSYCGRPLLRRVERVAAEEGCGCPCRADLLVAERPTALARDRVDDPEAEAAVG